MKTEDVVFEKEKLLESLAVFKQRMGFG